MLSGALRINNLKGQRKCSTPRVCAFIHSQRKRLLVSSVGVCLCVHDSADVFSVSVGCEDQSLPCSTKIHLLWVPLSATLHLTSMRARVCLSLFSLCIMCRQA